MNNNQISINRPSTILLFALLALSSLFQPQNILAQWATNGTDINNTNTGNVGVGTTTPQGQLQVNSSSATKTGQIITGAASQTADFFQAKSSTGAMKFSIRPRGGINTELFDIAYGSEIPAGSVGSGQSGLIISDKSNSGVYLRGVNIMAGTNNGTFYVHDVGTSTSPFVVNGVTGNVGIGTTTPASQPSQLQVVANTATKTGQTITGAASQTADFFQAKSSTGAMKFSIRPRGSINAELFDIAHGSEIPAGSVGSGQSGLVISDKSNSGIYLRGVNIMAGTNNGTFYVHDVGTSTSPFVVNGVTGNVGIGTTTPASRLSVTGDVAATGNITSSGNITASGSITAKYQDVAEWVPARHPISAGTVVVLDKHKSNQVMASFQAYDTKAAGVVSAQPGLILGEAGAGKVMVATTGRVKVKAIVKNSPIEVGDILVTSETEGTAMKSEPLMINGREFHSPGTIIGKALEPLASGNGVILVLLSLQ